MNGHKVSKPRGAIVGATPRNRRQDLMSQVIEDAPDAIWVLESPVAHPRSAVIVYANAAFENVYEVAREEAVGREPGVFLQADALAALESAQPVNTTHFHRRKDGAPMWLQIKSRQRELDGRLRWVVISRDVTERVLAQERAEQLARAIEEVNQPIVVERLEGRDWVIQHPNNAFARLFRYAPEELAGRSWRSLLAPRADHKRAEDCGAGLATGQKVHAELWFQRNDGAEMLLNLSGTPMAERGTQEYTSAVTLFSDVTERRREERDLRERVNRDPLTGLLNRREFEHIVDNAIRMTSAEPAHVLLFIDLDDFKAVNDANGHDAGDRVLMAVSKILKSRLLPSDDLARWGGDEFAAVLYFYEYANAVRTATRMIESLTGASESRGVGASIGVVPITSGSTVETLMKTADRLMYEAKASGRNRVVAAPAA